jgi:hypothetical protein
MAVRTERRNGEGNGRRSVRVDLPALAPLSRDQDLGRAIRAHRHAPSVLSTSSGGRIGGNVFIMLVSAIFLVACDFIYS